MRNGKRLKSIRRALSLLIREGSIAELRVLKGPGGTFTGLFDDLDAMADAATQFDGKAMAICFGLNPLVETQRSRVTNTLSRAMFGSTPKDGDVWKRRWLLMDFDAVRSDDVPSSDAELQATLNAARSCRSFLSARQWPEPILASSGNGSHLLYAINLPNDQASRDLIKACLDTLAFRFSSDVVNLDSGNFNASRVCRLAGTLNCRGKEKGNRVYRRATMIDIPDDPVNVTPLMLKKLSRTVPAKTLERSFDVAGWIVKNGLQITSEGPWSSGGYRWAIKCPWNKEHRKSSACILRFADGNIAARCLHRSCAGKDWPALRALFERQTQRCEDLEMRVTNSTATAKTRKPSAIVELESEIELFRTPDGDSCATVDVGGHKENHRVDGKEFRQFLHFRQYRLTGEAPKPQAIQEALAHFDAVARFDSPTNETFVRIAEADGAQFLDLGDEKWRVVRITLDGWEIVENPPVRFRRLPGMLPLPAPVGNGAINDLKRFLNFKTKNAWILFVADLLASLRARGPYPILALFGEAGSAKTTTSRIFRALIDPNVSPSRAIPKSTRDLMIAARNSWVLSFDNLSYLPAEFSDSLCRLSSGGGGFSTRGLYTNADEVIFEGQRPIVFNGVEELASRTDLLDRTVLLELGVIRDYREDRDFWSEFEAARPELLGVLLDVMVKALRNLPSVQLAQAPRMADFARFGTAAEAPLGVARGAFMRAYLLNREKANAIALEASPIAYPILELSEKHSWEGPAQELLRKLSEMVTEEDRKRKSWPRTPRVLSGMLRRLATSLRRAGVELTFCRDCSPRRTRMISIERQNSKENALG